LSNNDLSKQYINELFSSEIYKTEIKQIKSKLLLKEITSEETGIEWNYYPSRLIRNSILAISEIEEIVTKEPMQLKKYSDYIDQIAKLWESLAKLEEKVESD